MLKVTAGVLIAALAFMMSRCNTTAPSATQTATTQTAVEPADPNAALLVRMLQDQGLWGRYFGAALRALPAFDAAGEETVWVQRMQVVGQQRYKNRESASAPAARAKERLAAPLPTLKVDLPGIREGSLRSIEPVLFLDDRTWRVGTPLIAETEYVRLGTRIDAMIERYGKPDRVVEVLLDDGTEARPIGLKIYWFAGGAIALVTADINDDPRWIDRVFLDTRAVMRAIYR